MQAAYDEYNDHARSSGKSRGHFVIDLCRPGHLTICLRNFQERIKCNDDNWDAQFGRALIMSSCKQYQNLNSELAVIIVGEYWTSADIVDCIVSYTVTQLMDIMTDANSRDGAEMLARVSPSSTACICCNPSISFESDVITSVTSSPLKTASAAHHCPCPAVRRATDMPTQTPGVDR